MFANTNIFLADTQNSFWLEDSKGYERVETVHQSFSNYSGFYRKITEITFFQSGFLVNPVI